MIEAQAEISQGGHRQHGQRQCYAWIQRRAAPERYALDAENIFLEVRGARGAFSMTRLDAATFTFRRALLRGGCVGGAAEQALDVDPAFDAGRGLLQLIAAGLATAIDETDKDAQR